MDINKIFRSEIHRKIVKFFHENQSSLDTPRGVATWIGEDRSRVKKALEDNKINVESAEITFIPKSTVKVLGDDARKVLDLVEGLEEHEDVQNVYANFDIPDDMLKE